MSINTTMKKMNNPWFILGLEPGATLKEVKTAYKKLALKNRYVNPFVKTILFIL